MEQQGHWLSIIEYSNLKNLSVSTIRRYIKANRVKHKMVEGKYLIFVTNDKIEPKNLDTQKENLKLKLEVEDLKKRIRQLEEEKNDLRMLVDLYEGQTKNKSKKDLPEIPLN